GHQNIVDITDFGVLPAQAGQRDGQHAYFVMEFLDGPTLGKLVHELRHVPPARALAICTQVARGLAAAHEKSIIHRDLKPENIFVLAKDGAADFVKIVDFGIAKDVKAGKRLTAVGMVLGTPEYMSPEQATGQETDHRVDQYALGCILYEMLTGDVPFKGENAPKTLTKHVFDAVVPPTKLRPELEIPVLVEEIVLRMLQKKPADRYADMRAVIDAFEAARAKIVAGAAPARKTTLDGRTRRPTATPTDAVEELPRNKGPIYAALAVSVAAALVIAGVAITHLGHGAKSTPAATAAVTPSPTTTPQPPTTTTTTPPPTTGTTATAAGAAAAPTAAEQGAGGVQLQVATVPPGADVYVDAEHVGQSPVEIRRARAAAPVTVTVRRGGFKDDKRVVVLDRDQSLELVLAPRREKVAVRTARPAGKTPSNPQPQQPAKPQHRVTDLRNPFE
ncbi:MAG TPA: serine/threonine-protein kinase, partial [Polyangia bacterium]